MTKKTESDKSLNIDITSKLGEKAIDLAKDFLDKLVMPAVEETGLLIKDQVSYFRFKNQVKILNKAKDYCLRKKITPKIISPKLLVPLLENASLEEDEKMQDNWAYLLGNLVDSESNIQNNIFPHILSQISSDEFESLNAAYLSIKKSIIVIREKYNQIHIWGNEEISRLIKIENNYTSESARIAQFNNKVETMRKILDKIKNYNKEYEFAKNIAGLFFQPHEISNLIRLGLVVQNFSFSPRTDAPREYWKDSKKMDEFKTSLDKRIYLEITELGLLFFKACNEKSV